MLTFFWRAFTTALGLPVRSLVQGPHGERVLRSATDFLPARNPLPLNERPLITRSGMMCCSILNRFHDLVLLPDNPSATAHDSDSVSHEHHTYFFPDCGRGAANTAGFGWRGDSGV